MTNLALHAHFDKATVKSEIDRRLRQWGFYQFISNDPGLEPHKNILHDLILRRRQDWADVAIPKDWSDEEQVDEGVKKLTKQRPLLSACLFSRYVYHGPRGHLDHVIDVVMLRLSDREMKRISNTRYWSALSEAKLFIAGYLSRS